MTPQLRNSVVVGRFNPAIISPSWVVANGLLPEGEAEGRTLVGTNVVQYTLHGFTWQPTLNKLEVVAHTPEANPGQFVSRVLALLPHTPITAVGSNFSFEISETDGRRLSPIVASPLQSLMIDDDHEILEYTTIIALKFGSDCVINMSVASEKDRIYELSFNFNRFVPNASAGAEVAMQWGSDEAEAQRLFRQFVELSL